MKSKVIRFNKHYFIAVIFVSFIFFIMVSTVSNLFANDIEDTKKVYSSYLDGDFSKLNKVNAAFLTVKNCEYEKKHKYSFINIHGLTQRVIGNKYVKDGSDRINDVVKLDNGYITFIQDDNQEIIDYAIRNLTDFNEYLTSKDIDYLYVQAPNKVYKNDKKLPPGVLDYTNKFSDELISGLNQNGVKTINLSDEIIKQGLDHYSMFFKTDHHWKPQSGLWAAQEICKTLNSEFGFSIDTDILNLENFNTTVYENMFLGSQGKRVGKFYAGVDDFPLVLPNFETDLNNYVLKRNSLEQNLKGSFEETLIFKNHLEPVDYFEKSSYSAYTGGDFPLNIITNNKLKNKRIVFLRDSFSCVTTPFFSLAACNELHAIDPRHYKGSIREYVEEINPDIVISMHNPRYSKAYYNIR